jgi:hypothetical protein
MPYRISLFIACLMLALITRPLSSQDLVINEFQALNINTLADNYGEYDDWIELYNSGSLAINLNGYSLTDDFAIKAKSTLKAIGNELTVFPGQYLILWADDDTSQGSNHLSFKLSGTGEQIGLFAPDLSWVDSVTFPPQTNNVSMGRDVQNSLTWKYYPSPTPGSANTSQPVEGFSEKPGLSEISGYKTSAFQLSMQPSIAGDIIYYSLNSDSPDKTSPRYQYPLTISGSQVVRAAAYHQNQERSEIVSEFYLFRPMYTLPVLAIITDSSNLWGPAGIYTNYNNTGIAWERYAQFKYIGGGNLTTAFNAGIRIQGASSISMAKKSFRLFFRKEYGDGRLDYPLFGDENFSSFNNLVLKSGYDDDLKTTTGTLLRDALSNDLWARCGGLATQSEWALLYLNDKYWGIYNIRENINEEFITDHTQFLDFDLIRFNFDAPELRYGSIDRWNTWFNFINDNDLSVEANYLQLLQWMDMDYFINLMAFSHCTSYYSWGWGVSAFSENNPPAKWKFTAWDADRAFTWPDTNMFNNTRWADIIPFKLLQNDEFTRKFINRTCDLLNTVFIPGNSLHVLEKLYSRLKPDIQDEIDRWNPAADWEGNVDFLRYFLQRRPEVLIEQFPEKFSLGGYRNVQLKIQGKGTIRINTLFIKEVEWQGGYFENNAIELEAIPAKGYMFGGWNGTVPQQFLSVDLNSDTTLTAVFNPDYTAVNTVIVTEISSLSASGSIPGDWLELYNSGINPVDMSAWKLSDGNASHIFTFPVNTIIQEGAYMVVAEDKRLFMIRYPNMDKSIIGDFGLGANGFALNEMAETIFLQDAEGNIVDSVAYQNKYPWPVIMNAAFGSIQVKNTDVSNDDPYNWWFMPEAYITPGDTNVKTVIPGYVSGKNENSIDVYPNPFETNVSVRLKLDKSSRVDIRIYDLSGRQMATLYNGNLDPGIHLFSWDGMLQRGSGANSGVYLVVVRTPNNVMHQKIILRK